MFTVELKDQAGRVECDQIAATQLNIDRQATIEFPILPTSVAASNTALVPKLPLLSRPVIISPPIYNEQLQFIPQTKYSHPAK